MTDKNEPMTLEQAMEYAIDVLGLRSGDLMENYEITNSSVFLGLKTKCDQAAAVLRDGEPEVVKKSVVSSYKCDKCGHLNKPGSYCHECGRDLYDSVTTPGGYKTWTERRVLKPVTVKSEPVFEEVEDEA